MDYQLLTPCIPVNENITPVERVFANRGIAPSDINHYLNTTKEDLYDTLLLKNMQRGARLFISHLQQGHKIFLLVDPDVDGYTSSAAFLNYFNKIFPGRIQQQIVYTVQDGKQHGIVLEKIPKETQLVVMLDAGSNDYEQHRVLAEQNIDVLILDHHEADKESEYACVINNQFADYPNKSLSGVGVVYKFCAYIDSLLGLNYSDEIVDLAAFGMISDMMDLRDYETKEIIKLGTLNIVNPFLKNFCESQEHSLKGEVTPFGISFYVAPYINAVIRVGTYDEKMLLFESMLEFMAYDEIPSTKRGEKGKFETRVEQACRVCKNVKNRQTKKRDSTIELINNKIQTENLLENPVIIVQLDNPIDENLTGLIANQIMGEYMRPVLLLNRYIEVDDTTGEVLKMAWRGSGRNATYSKLENFREFLVDSGLVEYAQGHASAFGISIYDDQIDELKKYLKQKLQNFNFSNNYRVDFIWRSNEATQFEKTILKIGELNSVWGQGLPEPKIAIENITVHKNNLYLMSPDQKPTLKISLPGNLNLIKFRSSQEEYDNLYSPNGCVIINVVGKCNANEWNGDVTPQIIIEDYEIISKSAYYF